MTKHKARLQAIREREETERARIDAFGADLRADVRADKQKAMLDALRTDTQKQIDALKADAQKELDTLTVERQRIRFPALSASGVHERTLGELQVRNALDHGAPFDAESLREAVAIGRIDYASTLLDRAVGITPQTPEAIEQRIDFFRAGRELFAPLLTDLDTKRAAIQTVLREIEATASFSNFIATHPGSNAPSILTAKG